MARDFTRVCVGIDGSKDADAALGWASRFANRHDCAVEPIYAWDYPPLSYAAWPIGAVVPPETAMQSAAERGAAELFERWTAEAEAEADTQARVEPPVVIRGSGGAALVKQSADADLLVVGSRGLGAVKGLVIGSVSSYCAAWSTCPVAIVPSDSGTARIEKIVVGYDGSELSDEALRWAIDAYPGAAIEVVYVWHLPAVAEPLAMYPEYDMLDRSADLLVEKCIADVESLASAAGCKVTGSTVLGDARTELNVCASEADLLVIGVQAAHGLRRVFMGSVAQAVVHHITVPTVVVPLPHER